MDAPQGRCSRSGIDLLLSVGDSTRRRYTVVWSAGAGPGMGFVGWGVREAATGETGMAGEAPRRGCLAVWCGQASTSTGDSAGIAWAVAERVGSGPWTRFAEKT